jgi:hypothetical protein
MISITPLLPFATGKLPEGNTAVGQPSMNVTA